VEAIFQSGVPVVVLLAFFASLDNLVYPVALESQLNDQPHKPDNTEVFQVDHVGQQTRVFEHGLAVGVS